MWFLLRWLLLFLLAVRSHQEKDQEVPIKDNQLDLSSLYSGNETLWSSGILDSDNSTFNASSHNTAVTVDYQPEAEILEQNKPVPDIQYSSSYTQPPQKGFQPQASQQQPTSSPKQSQEPQQTPPTSPPNETLCPPQVTQQLPVPEQRISSLWRLEVPQQPHSPLQQLGLAQVSPEPHHPAQQLRALEHPGSSRQRLDVVQGSGSPLQRLQFAEVPQPRSQLQWLRVPQVPQQPGSPLQQRQVSHVPQQPGFQQLQVPQQLSSPLQQLQVDQWPQRPLYQILMPHYQPKYSHYRPMISHYQERLQGFRHKIPLIQTKHLQHPQQIRYSP